MSSECCWSTQIFLAQASLLISRCVYLVVYLAHPTAGLTVTSNLIRETKLLISPAKSSSPKISSTFTVSAIAASQTLRQKPLVSSCFPFLLTQPTFCHQPILKTPSSQYSWSPTASHMLHHSYLVWATMISHVNYCSLLTWSSCFCPFPPLLKPRRGMSLLNMSGSISLLCSKHPE